MCQPPAPLAGLARRSPLSIPVPLVSPSYLTFTCPHPCSGHALPRAPPLISNTCLSSMPQLPPTGAFPSHSHCSKALLPATILLPPPSSGALPPHRFPLSTEPKLIELEPLVTPSHHHIARLRPLRRNLGGVPLPRPHLGESSPHAVFFPWLQIVSILTSFFLSRTRRELPGLS
jgi:hypothetical protein